MPHVIRPWVLLLLTALLPFSLQAAGVVEGKDYQLLRPAQAVETPGKIEVIEFFSYACPHCADLNAHLTPWAAKLPSNVVFKRVPVLFNRAPWGNLARVYYSLEATGNLAALDQSVFTAIHQDGDNLANPTVLNEWLLKKKLDVTKFNDVFTSFGIRSKVNRADQMSRDYAIEAVPTLVISGQYMVNSELPHGQQLKVADALIETLRTKKKP